MEKETDKVADNIEMAVPASTNKVENEPTDFVPDSDQVEELSVINEIAVPISPPHSHYSQHGQAQEEHEEEDELLEFSFQLVNPITKEIIFDSGDTRIPAHAQIIREFLAEHGVDLDTDSDDMDDYESESESDHSSSLPQDENPETADDVEMNNEEFNANPAKKARKENEPSTSKAVEIVKPVEEGQTSQSQEGSGQQRTENSDSDTALMDTLDTLAELWGEEVQSQLAGTENEKFILPQNESDQ